MTAKWGRKSVILFYASVQGLLTLKWQMFGLYTDGESYIERLPNVAAIGADYRD